MPRVDLNTAVKLSVLDRLVDQEPDQSQEVPAGRLQSVRQLKAALQRDLSALLNTKRGEHDVPGEFTHLAGSVLAFGIPDFTALSLRNPLDQDRVRRSIEQAIRTFEPRLSGVTVSLEPRGELDPGLRFHIDAMLRIEPEPEPVSFDTVLQGDSGHFLVEGQAQ